MALAVLIDSTLGSAVGFVDCANGTTTTFKIACGVAEYPASYNDSNSQICFWINKSGEWVSAIFKYKFFWEWRTPRRKDRKEWQNIRFGQRRYFPICPLSDHQAMFVVLPKASRADHRVKLRMSKLWWVDESTIHSFRLTCCISLFHRPRMSVRNLLWAGVFGSFFENGMSPSRKICRGEQWNSFFYEKPRYCHSRQANDISIVPTWDGPYVFE